MSSLRTLTLSQCSEIVSGATPITSVDTYWDGDICWATPKDLSGLETHYISNTPRKITKVGLESCGTSILPPQSVLFSSRAPIGHVAINTVPMATNQGFKSFVPNPEIIDAKFLFHWLRTNRAYLESLGNGATFKEVSKATVSRIEICLPPLPEQRRIAAILDQADALRAKRREALAQLDSLTQSIFIEMFGDPATNPMKWETRPFKSQIESVRYGTGSPPPYVDFGVPFVRATNIKEGRISTKDLRNISAEDAQKLKKCRVNYGNLIVVRSGVNTGDCAVIPREYDGSCAAFDLIVDIDPDPDNAVFYGFLINSEYGRRVLEPLTRRAAQPHLNAEQLQSLPLIAPPVKLRKAFAEQVATVDALRVVHLMSLAELDTLFASLQHRAFRGEL